MLVCAACKAMTQALCCLCCWFKYVFRECHQHATLLTIHSLTCSWHDRGRIAYMQIRWHCHTSPQPQIAVHTPPPDLQQGRHSAAAALLRLTRVVPGCTCVLWRLLPLVGLLSTADCPCCGGCLSCWLFPAARDLVLLWFTAGGRTTAAKAALWGIAIS